MYFLDNSYKYYNDLARLLLKCSTDLKNQWFFTDGTFNMEIELERAPNTWLHENFIVGDGNKIIGYFTANWRRPLDIIENLRIISFSDDNPLYIAKAFMEYLDYLFMNRGCKSVNWIVPMNDVYLSRISNKFIKRKCGNLTGIKTSYTISYSGEVSDAMLFELSLEQYMLGKTKLR